MGWVNYMASEYLSKPGYHGFSDCRQGYTAYGGSSLNQRDVSLLIEEGESLTVEFKEKYTSRIDEDIVAFANTKGGVILLGVQDDGTVVGERLTNDLKGRINSLARNSQPPVQIDIMQILEVISIRVPEGGEKP
jgi:ATP-dependent DNA helicase RecG